MSAPLNSSRTPPYKVAGIVLSLLFVAILVLVYLLFRGSFLETTKLTMKADRSGLSMNTGGKVTYNGVEIGRVTAINEKTDGDKPEAELSLDVENKYLNLIPYNVDGAIKATTVFGNKYVALTSPEHPDTQRITPQKTIQTKAKVTTEFNTLFETVVQISEKVDPVKLNQTLTATAQALDGLGERFGRSIVHGNEILDDINPKMPQIREDVQKLAQLADVYADSSEDLWQFLDNLVTTAHTLNDEQSNIDAALMAAVGFGNTGADVFERGGPYLTRGAEDLVPTSQLLNEYSPELLCTIRNFHDVAPRIADSLGGNGYSLRTHSEVVGASNPYVYPDNLPRVNARGGPEGKPGCWQEVTRDLWPAPYLVMDTGASLAPYNHFELGQPLAIEYVWGRQIGENTINP
ncbi:MAG: phospholipid/cholesterol/gamma-HCH transport system substrate-binding protein [Mycobacterium sp.]|jgi:phospholipid/cholesterol/gamma-HCH transport system substrate-binding protein|nr:phospholipid/cholesterol/gamma-HCH transport system substrate-binding protein [Mycobacterium sp.]